VRQTICWGRRHKSIEKPEIRPVATVSLNRSSPTLTCWSITSFTEPGMQIFVAIGWGVSYTWLLWFRFFFGGGGFSKKDTAHNSLFQAWFRKDFPGNFYKSNSWCPLMYGSQVCLKSPNGNDNDWHAYITCSHLMLMLISWWWSHEFSAEMI